MPCMRCTTPRARTSSTNCRSACGTTVRRRAAGAPGARERRQRRARLVRERRRPAAPRRRAVERRRAPRDACAGHRRERRLLRRLRRCAAAPCSGVRWPRASSTRARLPPIAVARPRGEPSGAAAAAGLRRLPAEPRPDRQPRLGRAHRHARWRRRRDDALRALRRLPAAVAVAADAVHGRGMGRRHAVPLLLRLRRRSGARRSPKADAASSAASRALPMPRSRAAIPDPNAQDTFLRSRLDRRERRRAPHAAGWR